MLKPLGRAVDQAGRPVLGCMALMFITPAVVVMV
jgi:hypothetical protein